jgi:RNA recognition motif-containing protein
MSDRLNATRLYIGNIRRNSRESDIRRLFDPIGRLDNFVYYGDDEAYCEFRRHEDAEYAIRKLDGYPFDGRKLLVEWALVSLNRRQRDSREPRERLEDKKCYICGDTGHIQRDCRDLKRRAEERPRERGDEDLGRRREEDD